MPFTNPDSVHRASSGAVAPSGWGDTVNDDLNFFNSTLLRVAGTTGAGQWSDLKGIQVVTVTFSAISGGQTITYPVAYSSWSLPVVCLGDRAGTETSVTAKSPTATGFKAQVFNGSTEFTSGTFRINYFVIGN